MSSSDIANIYASINNLQAQFNSFTGNTLSNYNQINRIVSQQANINNSIYNGTGNIVSGNINFTGNIFKNGTLFNGSLGNNQWTTSGANIYFNSGNVGIGTINPQYKLDVSGNANINGTLMTSGIQSIFHSNVNYNVFAGAGGSTQNITVSNRGLYFFSCGANYNDTNVITTIMLTAIPGNPGRVSTIYVHPSFAVTLGNITNGFSISAQYPTSFNAFEIRYVYLGF